MRRASRAAIAFGVAASAWALASPAVAQAQAWPAKPIRWIVPFAAGAGPNDVLTRAYATPLAAALGQPFVIENRAASGGIVGTEAGAKAAPDGYTLLTTNVGTFVIHKLVYRKLPYDLDRDFTPVTQFSESPAAFFVSGSVPAKTMPEFIAWAKAQGGRANYASSGLGQPFQLGMELFKQRTGTELAHIPYKGAADFIPALVSGTVQAVIFAPVEQMLNLARAGKIRVLAAGDERRVRNLPDVPTFREAGLGDFSVPGWIGLVAPAGTPSDVVSRLSREIAKVADTAEMQKLYEGMSLQMAVGGPEKMAETVRRDTEKWRPVVRSLNLVLDP